MSRDIFENGKIYHYFDRKIEWILEVFELSMVKDEGKFKIFAGVNKKGYWYRLERHG